jgi:hypothetical protein
VIAQLTLWAPAAPAESRTVTGRHTADREPTARERCRIEAALAEERSEVRARALLARQCQCPRPWPAMADGDGDRTCSRCGREARR